jgi:hypothetical protein
VSAGQRTGCPRAAAGMAPWPDPAVRTDAVRTAAARWSPPVPEPSVRSPAVVAAELAELRRHLSEMPPHHGGGRAALEDRVRRLERELARATRER